MDHKTEVSKGLRFKFGHNWSKFLKIMNPKRIETAQNSLIEMFETNNFRNKSFLDAGSGSGLFSLAAHKLGANVHSFDYDPKSVACTRELKEKYGNNEVKWQIEEGSVVENNYMSRIGKFDFVYCWGVLHHTGEMYSGLENISNVVDDNGKLFIAIYNDQGWISRYWLIIKKLYNKNILFKAIIIAVHFPYLYCLRFSVRFLSGRLSIERGMSLWFDMLDWLGGYPFEVAKPEELVSFFKTKGFNLDALRTSGGRHGCNEFVFQKSNRISN